MTRYRLRPIVSEWDGDDLWVAALPDGPITWIGGVGALVVEQLATPNETGPSRRPDALDVKDIVQALRAHFHELPAGAEVTITEFLASLERSGLVARDHGSSDAR